MKSSEERDVPRAWDPRNVQIVQLQNGQKVLDIDGIYGFLVPTEVKFVFDMAASLPEGGTYLEIGSFMGLSATVFASCVASRRNKNARIFCVDTWEGSVEHQDLAVIKNKELYDVFKANITRAEVDHLITPCRGKSVEVASQFNNNSIDIIFIDGDHTYEGSLADMKAWLPKLKKGGRFLGHDAIPMENPTCGVRRALRDFTAMYGFNYKIYEPPVSNYVWEILF
jgi:predicted O-methyltransferase YrrM